jgi:hypothetical protein
VSSGAAELLPVVIGIGAKHAVDGVQELAHHGDQDLQVSLSRAASSAANRSTAGSRRTATRAGVNARGADRRCAWLPSPFGFLRGAADVMA